MFLHQQQPDEMPSEDEGEADEAEGAMELFSMAEGLENQEPEPALIFREEQFGELDRGNKKAEEDLKDKKVFCRISKLPESDWWFSVALPGAPTLFVFLSCSISC